MSNFWSWLAATQYILGIQPEYHGLRIDPCIPSAWDGFEVTRRFRGGIYHVKVRNPNHLCRGVRRLRVGRDEREGNLAALPDRKGQKIDVEVTLEG